MLSGINPIMKNNEKIVAPSRYLAILVSIHIFLFTLIPALSRTVLPLDTLEGLTWGAQWQWGYDKNPYLNAWMSQIFSWIGGASGWSLYLASQLCVALCFFAIYRLGKKFFSPAVAVCSAFLLEGIYYLTIASPQFNDNMLELALWPMAALFFYEALTENKLRSWLLMGVMLGLGLMAKYLTILLIVAFGLFALINPKARTCFKAKGFYLAVLACALIISPHVVWLFSHDFITITYAFNRAEHVSHFSNHFLFAFKFAAEQFLALLPSILLSLWFLKSRDKRRALSQFDKQFFFYVLAGPFWLLLLLSMVRGYALEPMWGVPFLASFTLIIVACWKPVLTRVRFLGLFYTALVLLLTVASVFTISVVFSPFSSNCRATAYYPGRALAHIVSQRWDAQYNVPVSYVAGPRWEAGNVAFYSQDKPSVYMEWNPKVSTWIDESQLKKNGAVFIWSIPHTDHPHLPKDLGTRFPGLILQSPVTLMQGDCKTSVSLAFLPPVG